MWELGREGGERERGGKGIGECISSLLSFFSLFFPIYIYFLYKLSGNCAPRRKAEKRICLGNIPDISPTYLKKKTSTPTPTPTPHSQKLENQLFCFSGSRYVYDLYYNKEAISKALYDWLLKNGYADANLIAKWKKQGYEKLCCLRCIQAKENNFNATCICRVPKARLSKEQTVECISCGCR